MTQAPTPGPLSASDVTLLVKGDLLLCADRIIRSVEQVDAERGVLWFTDGEACGPSVCAFIGRPSADGWMPWSGGENPVPGQRVEVKSRWAPEVVVGLQPSDGLSWSDIIAFRLAPTAPVEASGSELGFTARHDLGCAQNAIPPQACDCSIRIFKAPPVDARLNQACQSMLDDYQTSEEHHPDHILVRRADFELMASALRPRPSGETREVAFLLDRLADFENDINERDWHGHVAPAVARVKSALSTTPARAEDQDEGAAGSDAVSHHAKTDADPVVSMLRDVAERLERPEPDLLGARVGVQAVRLAVSSRLLAHPSPPPAADEDRVRIAVEALEKIKNRRSIVFGRGEMSGQEAFGIAAEALAALKSEAK